MDLVSFATVLPTGAGASFLLLAAASTMCLAQPKGRAWAILLASSLGLSFYSGLATPIGGLGALTVVLGLAATRRGPPRLRTIGLVVGSTAALAMMASLWPGFVPLVVMPETVMSAGAYPTSIVWFYEKPVAGLLLYMLWQPDPAQTTGRSWVGTVLAVYAILTGTLALGAVCLGVLGWAPHMSAATLAFGFGNLFFAVIPEEILFRGILQQRLERIWREPRGRWAALAVSSLLFGAAHWPGGPGYVVLATVAGAAYGVAYQRTGRLSASIAVHALLNLTHFALFTYPALRP